MRCTILNPKIAHRATLIWSHGLGDTAAGFAPLFSASDLFPLSQLTDYVRVVLTNAPIRPVTLNMGMEMPAWYDITSLDRTASMDEEGVASSSAAIAAVVESQADDLEDPSSSLFLGGFSQGGAISTHTLLSHPHLPIRSLIAWSAYVLDEALHPPPSSSSPIPDVLINHGEADDMVPPNWALPGWESLRSKWELASPDTPFDIVTYPGMGHEVALNQIADFDAWLAPRIKDL